jgi:hypothetical protein
MSKIAEFRAAELALGRQLAAFEALKNDTALKRELEFESAMTKLLDQYGVSRSSLAGILGITAASLRETKPANGEKRAYAKQTEKTFKNPHTGETITIKRLSHTTYKQWVEQYGEVVVQMWLQD